MNNRWAITLIWLVLYGSFALLSPPLLDGPDALHAEIAREMVTRGDAVTMYANGIRRLEEAPLLYWSMAGSMRVFGVGAPQARVPLALAILLLTLLLEAFARRAFQSSRTGLYAAGCLLLSPGLFFCTRILGPDALDCLWYLAAICCLWYAEKLPPERTGEAQVLPCLGFATACALGVLTTGPGSLLLPVATALAFLAWTRGAGGMLRRMGRLHPAAASAVFAMIAAPWHLLVAGANPAEGHPLSLLHVEKLRQVGQVHGWAWSYFVGRYLPHGHSQRVGEAFDLSPLTWVLALLPWCLFLPGALSEVRWRKPADASGYTDRQRLLLLLSLATLLPSMLGAVTGRSALPALPFLCMLLAHWLGREALEAEAMTVPTPLARTGLRAAVVLVVMGVALALVCAVLLLRPQPSPMADLAALLRHTPDRTALSFALFAKAADAGALRGPLMMIGIALLVGPLLNWHLRRAYRPHAGNMALAAATLLCLIASHVALNTLAPVLSSQPLAAAIAPMLRAGNRIVLNAGFESVATLGFYLDRNDLRTLQDPGDRPAEAFFSDAPNTFETRETLQQQWTGPERIFLWTDPTKLPALPSKAYIVAEGGGKQVVSNKAGPY